MHFVSHQRLGQRTCNLADLHFMFTSPNNLPIAIPQQRCQNDPRVPRRCVDRSLKTVKTVLTGFQKAIRDTSTNAVANGLKLLLQSMRVQLDMSENLRFRHKEFCSWSARAAGRFQCLVSHCCICPTTLKYTVHPSHRRQTRECAR